MLWAGFHCRHITSSAAAASSATAAPVRVATAMAPPLGLPFSASHRTCDVVQVGGSIEAGLEARLGRSSFKLAALTGRGWPIASWATCCSALGAVPRGLQVLGAAFAANRRRPLGWALQRTGGCEDGDGCEATARVAASHLSPSGASCHHPPHVRVPA